MSSYAGKESSFQDVRRMSVLGCVETMNPSILYWNIELSVEVK